MTMLIEVLPYLESARFALHVMLAGFTLGFLGSGSALLGIGLLRLIASLDVAATLGVMFGRWAQRWQGR